MTKNQSPNKTPTKPKVKALAKPQAPATTPTPEDKARMALLPSLNSACVIEAYQGNIMGKETSINLMIDGLRETFKEVKSDDLHTMEGMLIGQATALQTIFTSLARRAANQEQMRHYEAFLGLALKAQAQSRATISALVDLKYPRQATFVKQANIAHGPQQVNNGAIPAESITHAEENKPEQNKLLEVNHGQPGNRLDTRAAQAAGRADTAVEAVGKVNRANKSRR